jgi:hypothetical protein
LKTIASSSRNSKFSTLLMKCAKNHRLCRFTHIELHTFLRIQNKNHSMTHFSQLSHQIKEHSIIQLTTLAADCTSQVLTHFTSKRQS